MVMLAARAPQTECDGWAGIQTQISDPRAISLIAVKISDSFPLLFQEETAGWGEEQLLPAS